MPARRRGAPPLGRTLLLAVAALLALACPATAQTPEEKPGLLELTADTFASTLRALPEDRWVLMEFYAHW